MRKGLVFLFLALSVTLLGLLMWGQPALAAPLDPPARLERTLIENPSDYGQYASMALHPTTGAPWISYWYSATNELRLARYVGVDGNCGNGSWYCYTVGTGIFPTNPITGGMYSSLDFTPEGLPVIAFYGLANGLTIRVARYTCPTLLCSWTVTNVYNAYYFGGRGDLSLKVGSDGKARLAAYIPGYSVLWDHEYGKLVYMQERGDTSGTGCLTNTWQCDTVEEGSSNDGIGKHASLELYNYTYPFSYIEPHIAYYDTQNKDLKYAYRPVVGGMGNCGPGGNSWTCETIDATGDVGQYAVLAKDLSLSDKRWQIVYYDATNQALKFAYNVASGGDCGVGDAAGKWHCLTVEGPAVTSDNGIGAMEGKRVFSLATYQGHTAIAYYDNDDSVFNGTLKWARDGYSWLDGGNCGPKKTFGLPPYTFNYSTWRCDTLDSGLYFSGGFLIFRDVGQYPTIAYRSDGMARIAYYDVKSGLRYIQQNYAVYLPLTLKNH